jgi:hypothetical protein
LQQNQVFAIIFTLHTHNEVFLIMQHQKSSPTGFFVTIGTAVTLGIMLLISLKLQELFNVPIGVGFEMSFNLMLMAIVLAIGYFLTPEWFESTIVKLIAAAITLVAFIHPLTQYLRAEAGGFDLQIWWNLLLH